MAPQPPIVMNVLLVDNALGIQETNDLTRGRDVPVFNGLAAGQRPDLELAVDNLGRGRDGRAAGGYDARIGTRRPSCIGRGPDPPIMVNVLLIDDSAIAQEENDLTRGGELTVLVSLAVTQRPDVERAVDNSRRRGDGRTTRRRGVTGCCCPLRRENQRNEIKTPE